MNLQGKVWGQTSQIFNKNNVEVHRIVGKAGGYCSKHSHSHKFNLFFVESGALTVKTWMDYGLVDSTYLEPGQSCCVAPGCPHQFVVESDGTVAYEIYWVELESNDIERETVGGKE